MTLSAFFLHILTLIAAAWSVMKRDRVFLIGIVTLSCSALLLLCETLVRSAEMGFIALTNTFEIIVFLSLLIDTVLVWYLLRRKGEALPSLIFGGVLSVLLFLALASSPLVPSDVLPPVPALRSHWLVLHVSFTIAGEALFALAFVASILFLCAREPQKRDDLERLTGGLISIGYPLYTIGALLFGAIWAFNAWGSYWSWDPKEVWALVTWLTYTAYLHLRLVMKKRGRPLALLCVLGFAFTLFTFFGVNYLLGGLHSYA